VGDGFSVTREFRGAMYRTSPSENPNHISKGVQSVTVDGQPMKGHVIPSFDGGTHQVKVVMG